MSVNQNNRAIAANSSRWAKFVAFMKEFFEYANDYFGGRKRTINTHLNQDNQK